VPDERNGSAGFIVYQQDWLGHQPGNHKLTVIQTWFATRGEAEACRVQFRLQRPDADRTLFCITPAPKPYRAKGRR
jgi:hypothetical protein